jgi:hypothetical protein
MRDRQSSVLERQGKSGSGKVVPTYPLNTLSVEVEEALTGKAAFETLNAVLTVCLAGYRRREIL